MTARTDEREHISAAERIDDIASLQGKRARRAGHSTEANFERAWSRHFASTQIRLDMLGAAVGSLNYLVLMRQLWGLGQPDLMAGAAGCAIISFWPMPLSCWGRNFYLANRDWLLMAGLAFHHLLGAQLAFFVRLQSGASATPQGGILFAASHLIGSSVPWQAIDALMYRIRFRSFLLLQPLKLAASLVLEQQLCANACTVHPVEARTFASLVEAGRMVMGLTLALPQHLAANRQPLEPLEACLKLQAFLLASLAFVVPAAVIYVLEQDSRRCFAERLSVERRMAEGGSCVHVAGPDDGPSAISIGESGLVIYEPDDDEQSSMRRRAVATAMAVAVPAIFVAVDTVL